MDRRDFLKATMMAPSVAAAQPQRGARPADTPDSNGRPNVIWFFGDQHRAQAMSCAGDPNVYTPNLDNLSAQGVRFTQAVSGMPLCCPFRGSLLTGRYPHHCVPGHEYPLPDGQPTVAAPFKEAGYDTAYFGKWHLSGWHERDGRAAMYITPPEKRGGFDVWTGYDNNNSQYDCWVHGGRGKDAYHYRLPGYETDALTDLLIDYIRKQAAAAKKEPGRKPFFAALSVQPPHNPYVAPASWLQRHNGATLQLRPNVANVPWIQETARRDLAGYYAMIENLDWNLGRVRRALDEAGMTFNTHILFFSDHGDMHGSQGQFKKMTAYEESIRVPFIIGGESPQGYGGRRNGIMPVPMNSVDIAPTTLGLCGIPKPSWMEGTDYSHHRLPKGASRSDPDSAYIQSVVPTMHGDSVDKPWRGVVTPDGWKYVCFEGFPWLMFNLNEDPYEQANLAHNSKYRAQRKRLTGRLKQWIADTGDKFGVPEA